MYLKFISTKIIKKVVCKLSVCFTEVSPVASVTVADATNHAFWRLFYMNSKISTRSSQVNHEILSKNRLVLIFETLCFKN